MIILKLKNKQGDTIVNTQANTTREALYLALQHGWQGAKVEILEGIEEADGECFDFELLYSYTLDIGDYPYQKRSEAPQRPLEGFW